MEEVQDVLNIGIEFGLLSGSVTRREEDHVALILSRSDHLQSFDADLGRVDSCGHGFSETVLIVGKRNVFDLVTTVRAFLVGVVDSLEVIDGGGDDDGEVGFFLDLDMTVEVGFTVFGVRLIVIENTRIFDNDVALLAVVLVVGDKDGTLFGFEFVEMLGIRTRRGRGFYNTSRKD